MKDAPKEVSETPGQVIPTPETSVLGESLPDTGNTQNEVYILSGAPIFAILAYVVLRKRMY